MKKIIIAAFLFAMSSTVMAQDVAHAGEASRWSNDKKEFQRFSQQVDQFKEALVAQNFRKAFRIHKKLTRSMQREINQSMQHVDEAQREVIRSRAEVRHERRDRNHERRDGRNSRRDARDDRRDLRDDRRDLRDDRRDLRDDQRDKVRRERRLEHQLRLLSAWSSTSQQPSTEEVEKLVRLSDEFRGTLLSDLRDDYQERLEDIEELHEDRRERREDRRERRERY